MKLFIFQVLFFITLVFIPIYFISLQADGFTDPFYLRFTSKKQSSLILGSSRAAQGLQPAVMNQSLNRNDLYNFSFTIEHSPYGPAYFNSIKEKLKKEDEKGVFILCVNPWSLSSKTSNPNDLSKFRENDSFLNNLTSYNSKPNIEYLLKFYEDSFINLLSSSSGKNVVLHTDGWLEVNVDMDSLSVENRRKSKVKSYKNIRLPSNKLSTIRIQYFVKTLKLLKNHGAVYIVRLPIHPEIMDIENIYLPHFDQVIDSIAVEYHVKYMNLTPRNWEFQYTDGNHLYKPSGQEVSKIVANSIKNSIGLRN